jgi:hypothetical protein
MYFSSFKNKILSGILILLCGINNISIANTLETQLSRDHVTLGDSVIVTFMSNNHAADGSPDFSVLQKDFRILNTDYGNALNMVNGVTSTQTFWRLQLEPKRSGELLIPEINFGKDKSSAHSLVVAASQVTQPTPPATVNAKQNLPVFVRAEINPSTPYVQGQALYTFKLYFRTPLRDPRLEIPQIKDVVFIPLAERGEYQTSINGEIYHVVEKTFAIFPKNPGAIIIPPMQFHAFTIDENASPFDNPFYVTEPKAVTVATRDIHLSVRDVPPNYTGTAWLPAKNISLTEEWSNNSNQWESGTPVTRTITIAAQGLRADQLPDIAIDKIDGVNVYADRPNRTTNIENEMVTGILQQKITYIPNSTHAFTIPPVKINWWDTKTDSKSLTQLNEMSVVVKGVVSNPHTQSPSALAPVNTALLPETKIISNPFYNSIWLWAACAMLAVWAATLWLLLRKKPGNTIESLKPVIVSEKDFEQACRAGMAMLAQQYLLIWANKHWPHSIANLSTLNELITDWPFQIALHELEQALYARKDKVWNGEKLLAAFQKIENTRKNPSLFSKGTNKQLQVDPLPPLNPAHAP